MTFAEKAVSWIIEFYGPLAGVCVLVTLVIVWRLPSIMKVFKKEEKKEIDTGKQVVTVNFLRAELHDFKESICENIAMSNKISIGESLREASGKMIKEVAAKLEPEVLFKIKRIDEKLTTHINANTTIWANHDQRLGRIEHRVSVIEGGKSKKREIW